MIPVRTYYVQKPDEEDKKKFELKNKSKIIFFSRCPSFVFVFGTLISPNLHIILKKNYIPE